MKRLISQHFVIIFLLAFSLNTALSEELDLKNLIELALDNNPQVDIAYHQFYQSQGTVTQAQSVYLPHLAGTAGFSRQHIKDLVPVDEDNVISGSLAFSQLIFDFGRATGLISSSKYLSDAAKSSLTQSIQDIIYQVKEQFYIVLEKEGLIEVSTQAVETYKQHLYRAQKYYEAGVRTKIDVTNAEVELSNAKLDLLHASSDLKTARVKLEQVLGIIPAEGNYTLNSNEPELDMISENKPAIEYDLPFYLDGAIQNRAVLAQINSFIEAADASLTGAQGNYWPSLDATGEYTAVETDISSLQDQWYVGVSLTWEFFSGFETEGQVAEASGRLRESKASYRDAELAIIQDVTNSFLRAEENREAVDLASQTLQLAQENLDLAEGRYKAGLSDMIEFNDAQLSFTKSQSNLVISYYSYLTALARIERAAAMIPEYNEDILEEILNQNNW